MEIQSEQLFAEIHQIVEQYRSEVPGQRRAWPESVKKRVRALLDLGAKSKHIAQRTGLPYHTILSWWHDNQGGRFKAVAVVSGKDAAIPKAKVGTVTVPTQACPTITLLFPSGIRAEGVGIEFLLGLLPSLGVVTREP